MKTVRTGLKKFRCRTKDSPEGQTSQWPDGLKLIRTQRMDKAIARAARREQRWENNTNNR